MKEKKALPYYSNTSVIYNIKKSSDFRRQIKVVFIFNKVIKFLWEMLAYNCPINSLRILFHRWRGVNIGKNVFIGLRCTLDHAYPEYIYLEDNVILTGDIYLIAHSKPSSHFKRKLQSYVAPIIIMKNTFVGVNTTILPGVTIGEGSVISAGSVVFNSVPSNSIVNGNPAVIIRTFK